MRVITGNRSELIGKSSFLFQLEEDALALHLEKFFKVGFSEQVVLLFLAGAGDCRTTLGLHMVFNYSIFAGFPFHKKNICRTTL